MSNSRLLLWIKIFFTSVPWYVYFLYITGIVDYCKRYSEGAVKVQDQTFKQIPVLYDVPTAEKIQAEYNQTMPLDKIQDKRRWRDDRLAALAKLKQQMGKNDWRHWLLVNLYSMSFQGNQTSLCIFFLILIISDCLHIFSICLFIILLWLLMMDEIKYDKDINLIFVKLFSISLWWFLDFEPTF